MYQNLGRPMIQLPLKSTTALKEDLASFQAQILSNDIANFNTNLQPNEEIALVLTNFGKEIIISIESIGYSDPCLIHFYGYLDGQKTQLTQHISQINVLYKIHKLEPDIKPTPFIGFKTD